MGQGDCVFLTGATGFVGSHILLQLLEAGYRVRALIRPTLLPNSPFVLLNLSADDRVEHVEGDMRRPGEFARALDGCRYLVHSAALYSFAPRDRGDIHAINVTGTAGLVVAAHVAGVERVVLTSSSATIDHAQGAYHHSKLEQERAAFAGRVPVVALLPTAPVGPGDWKPTPTGKLILDFARGKIVAKAPGEGGMNLVAVEDVARAHVAALQHGRSGERYVIGGENLSMDRIWEMLAEITGKPMPSWRAPYALALAAAYADDARCRVLPDASPEVPLEGVRLSRERMYADSSKAQRDLDYQPTSVHEALQRAVRWYDENGYLHRRNNGEGD
jgi:dihydroflavonol-4-reductase